ncbi:glycine-rich domain-containing protein [Chryseobacterium indoltheticum]|uniref:glycine-rich domain-containing protein n=1 Tax=Chryseobacterium indoltheticum TaxID=254 RepID=UPI0040428300
MMNKDLWEKIELFDFDHPPSEYDFTLRLAHENYWTQNFTKQAILEYKKFMYLAAVSDMMVSPSEIVDTVWHQHLIFTKSYSEFCTILGKQIQHIPSTHNKEDFQKFKLAKERTTKLYETHFGKQPESIWNHANPYESLNLKKSNFKLRTSLIIGIIAFIVLSFPLYFLLKPLYFNIKNPDFIFLFLGLIIVSFVVLEWYNQRKFAQAIHLFNKNYFVFDLQPYELIYLKDRNISSVVNGTVNELIDNGSIKINEDQTISTHKLTFIQSREHQQVIDLLKDLGKTSYPNFLIQLITKPAFSNIIKSMDEIKKYFIRSKVFSNLFVLNFIVFLSLIMFGFLRIVTGILRDKPALLISFAVVILIFMMIGYLLKLTNSFSSKILPDLYKTSILPKKNTSNDWQWSYFLMGTAVLTTSFVPLTAKSTYDGSGGGCGTSSSSDSSCGGSSCSSCGGCGGD